MARTYIIGNKTLDSVTTITGILAIPALLYFYGKFGTKKATAIKNTAGKYGAQLHKFIKHNTRGKVYRKKLSKRTNWMVNQYLHWKDDYTYVPLKAEVIVYSKKHGYAGTLDNIGTFFSRKIDDVVGGIVDWKSGSGIYFEHLLQVVAYYFAYMEMHPKPKIPRLAIVRFDKKRKYGDPEVRWIKRKEREKLFKVFLHLLKVYKGRKQYK